MIDEEGSQVRPQSSFLPIFPLELWDIIIEYLRNEETVQSLSRLAQTCPMLRARIEPLLYQPVRLQNSESGARLARTIMSRPELAPLIREIQHKEDSGFEQYSQRYSKFYQWVVTLPRLERLFLRNEIKLLDTSRWASEDERHEELENWLDEAWASPRPLKQIRDFGVGPQEESSFSPPMNEKFISEFFRRDRTLWNSSLQTPTGFPALRVCHIGSAWDLTDSSIRNRVPEMKESIFRHPGLRKLCITGCSALATNARPWPPLLGASTKSTALEDLTILNCWIHPDWVMTMLQWPKALKRLTFRTSQITEAPEDPESRTHVEKVTAHCPSLEFLDYDFYWGHEEETDFYELPNLKHLTTTLSTLVGRECHELDVEDGTNLPESLESLTLRYDEHKAWALSAIYELVKSEKLPNLRRFRCEVPENIENLPSINPDKTNPPFLQICQEGDTWQDSFKELNVELSMVPVPYPLKMPRHAFCSCECLDFYHRLPAHLRGFELRTPGEDDDFDEFDDVSSYGIDEVDYFDDNYLSDPLE